MRTDPHVGDHCGRVKLMISQTSPRLTNVHLIYGRVGFRIILTGPGSCSAPRALVLNPRALFPLSGIQLVCPWDWHTLDSRVGFWPRQIILVAGRLVPGPQFKSLSTTQPALGMQAPAPGADSLLGLRFVRRSRRSKRKVASSRSGGCT